MNRAFAIPFFSISNDLLQLLISWEKQQRYELAHATPHKLRHTGAPLAKQAGMTLKDISEALTHSDTGTTQIYVNTSNVVPMAVGEFALKSLKQ
ncbi:tyrosine-type recombinase/integrase [Streptococcus pseudopneumoniae]|uniref:tyrosine-type recombinase/integrase n=1 Tax=Streptococcus pseudopneumoniae TaxID=257758 RepID=UPI0012D754FA|nr:tyrosine-type recombinase/integrase [Streptococcus pseudopneumoniae]MBW8117299.1 tyrosine-type recombinase/integrase [Streptococcus pseudopneumoniae]